MSCSKIALAGCSGLSSDQPLRRRLGDDYPAVITVAGPADREQERYPLLEEKLEIDLSGLTPEEVERLVVVVHRAIEQVCTVGRTLKSGAEVHFEVNDVGRPTFGLPRGCTATSRGWASAGGRGRGHWSWV